MTKGNKYRLTKSAEFLEHLACSGSNAQSSALQIIDVVERLQEVLSDLILRPEVNS